MAVKFRFACKVIPHLGIVYQISESNGGKLGERSREGGL